MISFKTKRLLEKIFFKKKNFSTQLNNENLFFNFIPPNSSKEISNQQLQNVLHFIKKRNNLILLSGAGCSTESGIPDYRSPNGSYSKGHKPIQYLSFINSELTRQRYWARNMEGWPWFSSRKPNNAHNIIYHLEKNNILKHIITQNVDQLHQKAGNKNVIELHGNSYGVSCIQCKYFITRQHMQDLLIQLNPNWKNNFLTSLSSTRPDGDIELGKNIDYDNFKIPNCEKCKSGILKPTVTFFGENVSSSIVDYTMNIVKKSDGLLVVGSSLEVYSAFRFVLAAKNNNIPIIIINIGNTRADNLATIKIEAKCGEILPIIYSKLFYNIP